MFSPLIEGGLNITGETPMPPFALFYAFHRDFFRRNTLTPALSLGEREVERLSRVRFAARPVADERSALDVLLAR